MTDMALENDAIGPDIGFEHGALEAIEALVAQSREGTLHTFTKGLKSIAPMHGLDLVLQIADKTEFSARARALFIWLHRRDYCEYRLKQLKQSDFKFWIYSCHECQDHQALDQMVFPSDHRFWEVFYPANSWSCSCYATGCRSLEGAQRMGGDTSLTLPDDWEAQSFDKSSPYYLSPFFRSQNHPGLVACLQALLDDEHFGL
jgi:hypothetical protein